MTERIEGHLLDWVRSKAAQSGPLALLEGYPYAGFAVLRDGELHFPPATGLVARQLNWDLFSELRLFGGETEWHAWRTAGGWFGRPRPSSEPQGDPCRDYALWGTKLQPARDADLGWRSVSEENGATIWLPPEFPLRERGTFPLRLRVRLFVEPDPQTGLAGIVDAAICALRQE